MNACGWNPFSKAFSSAMPGAQKTKLQGGSTFVLVVEVRGFEPLASFVRVSGGPPLCDPAFPQVAADRQGQS